MIWPHFPIEHTDHVAIPPVTLTVCGHCQIGDGYEPWPCLSEQWRREVTEALAFMLNVPVDDVLDEARKVNQAHRRTMQHILKMQGDSALHLRSK